MKRFKSSILIVTLVMFLTSSMSWAADTRTKTSVKMVKPVSKITINPQPEPPGKASGKFVTPGSDVAFNPQPEPPAKMTIFMVFSCKKQNANKADKRRYVKN